MERPSGKRENEGEEVSTLLGGLARFFPLGDVHTFRHYSHTHTHTGVCKHTHMLMTQMSSGGVGGERGEKKQPKKVASADAGGAEHMYSSS